MAVQVEVKREITASGQTVWDYIKDFGGLDKWAGPVSVCEIIGDIPNNNIGSMRKLTFTDGGSIQERLTELDNDKFILSYSIPGDDLPHITNYNATTKVIPKDDSSCEFVWSATFDTTEEGKEQALQMINGLFNGVSDDMVKHFQ